MFKAIDIHAHFGDVDNLPLRGFRKECSRMSIEEMSRTNTEQNIVASGVSPLEAFFAQNAEEIVNANSYTENLADMYDWFFQWVVINPLYKESYLQAEKILKNKKCLGIKIHPFLCNYDIEQYGNELFSFCRAHNAIMLSHCGDKNCMPESFIPFANSYPDVTLIMAHQGWGGDGVIDRHVNALKKMNSRNVYIDVSSQNSIINHVIEWGVKELTADKFFFGTDSPLHNIPMMKARIEYANISDSDKQAIFCANALRVFPEKFDSLLKK